LSLLLSAFLRSIVNPSVSSVGPPNKIQQRALPFLLRGTDIIAQAPPTQERIAAYVIPAIQVVLATISARPIISGPIVVMVSTTVDQATQAQRMIRDLGGPIGVRSALGVGIVTDNLPQELRLLQQNVPHIICGTPQKLHALFTHPSAGLSGASVRFLVLDEVDQLIARNLHDAVFHMVKLFPSPRARSGSSVSPSSASSTESMPFQAPARKMSTFVSPADDAPAFDRQTALFSNTVPQDVLNLATTIQLRDPVRVLVRRDGNVTQAETNQGTRGLRQFYLYLAFTAGARADAGAPAAGLGIIGSGRASSSAETAQAREWKLDALADLFDDIEITHAIVYVGGMTSLDAVAYKLATKGLDTIPLVS
jgi:translation initiation factor 4A